MKFLANCNTLFYNIFYFKTLSHKCSFGKRVKIEGNVSFGTNISFDDNVEVRNRTKFPSYVGNNTSINRNSVLRGYFKIGQNVAIAPNCTIIGGNHNFSQLDIPIKQQGVNTRGGVIIEDDVWIGANCVILDGVTIGTGSVIGAGSIVTKSIPPFSIAVGNPCKVIKSRK